MLNQRIKERNIINNRHIVKEDVLDLIDRDELTLLGKGGSGTAYSHCLDDSCYSVKIVDKRKSYNEIYALKQCNKLIDNHFTQNLPMFYGHVSIRNNTLLFSELMDGSLKSWLLLRHSVSEWYSMLFQILNGIYTLESKLRLVHNDLSWDNILFKKVPKGGHFCYSVKGVNYYIPNEGYIFYIWDFGSSHSLNDHSIGNSDKKRTSLQLNSGKGNLDKLVDIENRIKMRHIANRYRLNELLKFMNTDDAKNYIKNERRQFKIGSSTFCKMNQSCVDIDSLPNKDKFTNFNSLRLYRSIVYYLVEHNHYDTLYSKKNTVYDKDEEFVLPPIEISKLLDSMFNSTQYRKDRSGKLIYTLFSSFTKKVDYISPRFSV